MGYQQENFTHMILECWWDCVITLEVLKIIVLFEKQKQVGVSSNLYWSRPGSGLEVPENIKFYISPIKNEYSLGPKSGP